MKVMQGWTYDADFADQIWLGKVTSTSFTNPNPLITTHHLNQDSSLKISRDVILLDAPSFPFDYEEDIMF
jgi:hypothetical protein